MVLPVSYEVGGFYHKYSLGMYLCTNFKDIQNLIDIRGL